ASAVSDPFLSVPDVILSPSDYLKKLIRASVMQHSRDNHQEISPEALEEQIETVVAHAQKATDVLEFMVSTGFEELHRSTRVGESAALATIMRTITEA